MASSSTTSTSTSSVPFNIADLFIELSRVKRYFKTYGNIVVGNSAPQQKTSMAGKTYMQIDLFDRKTERYIMRWVYCIKRFEKFYLMKKALKEKNEELQDIANKPYAQSYVLDRKLITDSIEHMMPDDGKLVIEEKK